MTRCRAGVARSPSSVQGPFCWFGRVGIGSPSGTLVSQLSLFFVLLLALRHIGVSQEEIAWQEVLAVFAFARLLTAIPITPGGVGVVDVALIAGLAAAGGSRDEVTAAVLVYRLLTYVLPIPLGVLTYLFWRGNRSWRRPPNCGSADAAGAGDRVTGVEAKRCARTRATTVRPGDARRGRRRIRGVHRRSDERDGPVSRGTPCFARSTTR